MTGFGTGEAPLGGGRLWIEVRSLNHRFLEARVRLPTEIAEHAFYVEQRCRELLHRGRYDVNARLEGPTLPAPSFDLERARAAHAALRRLRDEFAPETEVPLALLASMPELLSQQTRLSFDEVRRALDTALSLAVASLDHMRTTEGDSLRTELKKLLSTARELRASIAASQPEITQSARRRIQDRLDRLLREHELGVDPARLESEVVLLAERADVTEELARLESHFEQFERSCDLDTPVGRKLDFLLQEVGREANTIGAKSQEASLTHLVVELKAGIERMREQVQNVE